MLQPATSIKIQPPLKMNLDPKGRVQPLLYDAGLIFTLYLFHAH